MDSKILHTALENSPSGYLMLDQDLVVRYCNQRAAELLDRKREELNGAGLDQGLFVGFEKLKAFLQGLSERKAQQFLSASARAVNSSEILVKASVSDGIYHVWISEAGAEQVYTSELKEWFAVFVHELGNAITTGSGYTDLIRGRLVKDKSEKQQENPELKFLEKIRESFSRSIQLIENIRWQLSQDKFENPVADDDSKLVMIVDDEPLMAQLLGDLISKLGYKTIIFTDSLEARDWFPLHMNEVDLMILDFFMPGRSGIDLATEFLTLDNSIPIILCTGDKDLISKQKEGSFNIRYFLSKPVDINQLRSMVSEIFAKS